MHIMLERFQSVKRRWDLVRVSSACKARTTPLSFHSPCDLQLIGENLILYIFFFYIFYFMYISRPPPFIPAWCRSTLKHQRLLSDTPPSSPEGHLTPPTPTTADDEDDVFISYPSGESYILLLVFRF